MSSRKGAKTQRTDVLPECRVAVRDVRKLQFKSQEMQEKAAAAFDWFLEKTPTQRAAAIIRAHMLRGLIDDL